MQNKKKSVSNRAKRLIEYLEKNFGYKIFERYKECSNCWFTYTLNANNESTINYCSYCGAKLSDTIVIEQKEQIEELFEKAIKYSIRKK